MRPEAASYCRVCLRTFEAKVQQLMETQQISQGQATVRLLGIKTLESKHGKDEAAVYDVQEEDKNFLGREVAALEPVK